MKTRIISVLLLAFISFSSYAQDKIYKSNGEVIEAKIKTVGVKTITYQRTDNQTGPDYTIIKNDVEKIVYKNGTVDEFHDKGDIRLRHHHGAKVHKADAIEDDGRPAFKPNVLAIAPLQFTENGLGASVSYERALDKDGIITFYLPVMFTLNLSNKTYYDSLGNIQNGHQDMMVYAMPGIKIYPTGCYGVVRYAIGPSLVVASGQKSELVYDHLGMASSYETQPHMMLGMVVNNSLNINPNEHIYLGIEFGFGFTYLNRVNNINQNTNGLVQGSFKVGYRF